MKKPDDSRAQPGSDSDSASGQQTLVGGPADQQTMISDEAGQQTLVGDDAGQQSLDTGPIRSGGERFDLGELLGEGGLSTVHEARDVSLRRLVALKFLKRSDNVAAEKFIEEAQITAQLQHPNIVPVYDLGYDAQGRQFLAMKSVEGDELAAVITRAHKSTGGRGAGDSLRGVLAIFCKVCDAVSYAHSCGVIHRDLKPANIMVGAFGEVLVMDWGLAKPIGFTTEQIDDAEVATLDRADRVTTDRRIGGAETLHGTVQGTPAYMAPEQAISGSSLNEGCDIYALGGILYTVISGQQPIEGDTIEDLLASVIEHELQPPSRRVPTAGVPSELEAIVLKAMAFRRQDRYASVLDLKDEIEAYLDNRYVAAARYSLFQRLQKWVRRHPTAGVTIVMSVLVLAIASLGLSLYLDSERRAQLATVAKADAERQAAQEREQAAAAREQAASAREQAAAAREQTADAREQTAVARELAAEQETDRIAAEQREREERYRRLVQEEKFADLKRDLAVETHGRRDEVIEEFIAAWDNSQKQGYTQDKFSASLNRNDVDRFLGAFERRFRAFPPWRRRIGRKGLLFLWCTAASRCTPLRRGNRAIRLGA